MLPRKHPDGIHIAFDDHRLVANAGLLLPAILALRLGLGEVVERYLDLSNAPGRANIGDKLLTLVASALPRARNAASASQSVRGVRSCSGYSLWRTGSRWTW